MKVFKKIMTSSNFMGGKTVLIKIKTRKIMYPKLSMVPSFLMLVHVLFSALPLLPCELVWRSRNVRSDNSH